MVTKSQVKGNENLGLTKGIKDLSNRGMAYLFKHVRLLIG